MLNDLSIYGVSRVLLFILQFIALVAFSRLITPIEIGQMSMIFIMTSLSAILLEFGLIQSYIQKEDVSACIEGLNTYYYVVGLLFSLMFYLVAMSYAKLVESTDLTKLVRVISPYFLIYSTSLGLQAFNLRKKNFNKIAAIDVLSYIGAYLLIGIPLAYLEYGVYALIAAFLSEVFLRSMLYYILTYECDAKFKFKNPSNVFSKLSRFGKDFTIVRFVNQFTLKFDQVFLAWLSSPLTLGFYNRSFSLNIIPVALIGHTLNIVMLSSISDDVRNKKLKWHSDYQNVIYFTFLVILPLQCVLVYLAYYIIDIILGAQWLEVVLPFQILMMGFACRVLNKGGEAVLSANGKTKSFLRLQLIYFLFIITLVPLGYSQGSISGVAGGVTLSVLGYAVLINRYISRNLITSYLKFFIPFIYGAGITIVTVFSLYIAEVISDTLMLNYYLKPAFCLISGLMVIIISSYVSIRTKVYC